MSALPGLVSKFGLWWPEAEPDALQQAATDWEALGRSLEQVAATAGSAVDRLASDNRGQAITASQGFGANFSRDLTRTAAMAQGQADMLRQYKGNVDEARQRIIEIAATIAATMAAGFALSFVTFGASEAGALSAAAALVAAAEAVGISLSTTVAGIIAGAVEAVVLDVAVAQPVRIYGFHDGGWSLPEAGLSAAGGGIGGGVGAKWQAWRAASGAGGLAGGRPVVTEEKIRNAMRGAPLQTIQEASALPKVQRFVNQLADGSPAPPIIVQENVILDGNHRYIAGRLFGREPDVVNVEDTFMPRLEEGEEVVPWDQIRIDRFNWPDDDVHVR